MNQSTPTNYNSLIGKQFIVQERMAAAKIKKRFKHGGGFLEKGEVITITGYCWDIDDVSFGTDKSVYRIKGNVFADPDFTIQIN